MIHCYDFLKRLTIVSVTITVYFLFVQGISYTPPSIDHSKVLRALNSTTFRKGKEIYQKACATCHGTNGTASLPQARSFNKDVLRFGNKPYDMWKTISNGAGLMAAQTWLSPEERYYVIQYIREEFMKSNSGQYFKVTDKYLATLPRLNTSVTNQKALIKSEAKKGSLQYGQEWFSKTNSDYGKALYTQVQGNSTSSLTISPARHIFLSYDLHRMRMYAAWKGKFNLSNTKYKLYRGEGQPSIEGGVFEGLEWQWTIGGLFDSLNTATSVRKPLDQSFMKFRGHYVSGSKTILSYSILGRDILEFPAAIQLQDGTVISQTITVGPGKEQRLIVGKYHDSIKVIIAGSWSAEGKFSDDKIASPGNSFVEIRAASKGAATKSIFVAVMENEKLLRWNINQQKQVEILIPASDKEMTFMVLRKSGATSGRKSFGDLVRSKQDTMVKSVLGDTKVIPVATNGKIVLPGQMNAARPHFDPRYSRDKDKSSVEKLVSIPVDYPYTVDNIPLPFNNTPNAWIRPTALAFMPDGRLLLTTYTGDVWSANGIDETLSRISWQRIATGLYEPMGIRVINQEIFVTCRNGIMKLHDLNADKIIDYYEQYYADQDVSNFFHAFNFGLETDTKGNMYYVKPGEYTDNRDPGNVMRVSADGSSAESIATGFRVNNGITISPDDVIFVSDNQGNWTPGNKLNVIETGKYYGYVPNLVSDGWSPDGKTFPASQVKDGVVSKELIPVPDTFAQPALWMPQEFDNSPGGGVWSDASWGPLGNRLIHTSYGTGWSYYVIPKKVEGAWQASMIALPFQFDAGIQRAAVNPVDKQVYVTGLTGWDDGVARSYGTLARIRYKGGAGHFIDDINVLHGAISVRFNFKVKVEEIRPDDFDISMWNYLWTSNYGSAHYSVNEPGKEGEDKLEVAGIGAQAGEQAILLNIPALKKANTVRIRMKIKASDGAVFNETIYLTINKIPGE